MIGYKIKKYDIRKEDEKVKSQELKVENFSK
jgi:hypothetical protein